MSHFEFYVFNFWHLIDFLTYHNIAFSFRLFFLFDQLQIVHFYKQDSYLYQIHPILHDEECSSSIRHHEDHMPAAYRIHKCFACNFPRDSLNFFIKGGARDEMPFMWQFDMILTAIDESLASDFIFKSLEFICWSHVTFGIKILLGAKVTSVVFAACIISRVNGLTVSSIFKKSEGSFGKAVAAIKAEFSKERNFLKIDNHILDQFELGLKISFSQFVNSGTKF